MIGVVGVSRSRRQRDGVFVFVVVVKAVDHCWEQRSFGFFLVAVNAAAGIVNEQICQWRMFQPMIGNSRSSDSVADVGNRAETKGVVDHGG